MLVKALIFRCLFILYLFPVYLFPTKCLHCICTLFPSFQQKCAVLQSLFFIQVTCLVFISTSPKSMRRSSNIRFAFRKMKVACQQLRNELRRARRAVPVLPRPSVLRLNLTVSVARIITAPYMLASPNSNRSWASSRRNEECAS